MSETKDDGPMKPEPAFPSQIKPKDTVYYFAGITMRDYFAAQALAAWASHIKLADDPAGVVLKQQEIISRICYQQADAMLKARQT